MRNNMELLDIKNKENFAIIMPLHTWNKDTEMLFPLAISSVEEGVNVIVSCPKEIEEEISSHVNLFPNVTIYASEGDSNFQALVMKGVEALGTTKWFSIMEFDDTYTDIWFDEVRKYIAYYPETSVFLPLEELYDFQTHDFIGYGNESPWATAFSNEVGYIDNECIQEFFDFYLTGGVFNTQDFINCGGLKPSMKVSFWYEFLLRATNLQKKIFVIPKVGYIHNLNRIDSLYEIYNRTIDEKESKFWFDLAKKEYFHKADRNKQYKESK